MNIEKTNIILSGGGTGGHIYPAISIANELKNRLPNAKINFVGAKGKMEMNVVPNAGYSIFSLWIKGINRSSMLKNILLPLQLIYSIFQSALIIIKNKPNILIGTGGFVSGPMLFTAIIFKIPIIIQEQNSYPGITNKILEKYAKAVCVAYSGINRYFKNKNILYTGNPVRKMITDVYTVDKEEAYAYFNLAKNKQTIFVVGGSLGAKTLNTVLLDKIKFLVDLKFQILWQTGKATYEIIKTKIYNQQLHKNIIVMNFIDRMDFAYSIADIIISRAGGISISELAIAGKTTILVPYPYATENHQYKNAMTLVKQNAALLITDDNLDKELLDQILKLKQNPEKMIEFSRNMKKIAKPNATKFIVDEILKYIKS